MEQLFRFERVHKRKNFLSWLFINNMSLKKKNLLKSNITYKLYVIRQTT